MNINRLISIAINIVNEVHQVDLKTKDDELFIVSGKVYGQDTLYLWRRKGGRLKVGNEHVIKYIIGDFMFDQPDNDVNISFTNHSIMWNDDVAEEMIQSYLQKIQTSPNIHVTFGYDLGPQQKLERYF